MHVVPTVSTPQTLESIAQELREAFAVEFGRVIDATTAELLTAQILIETANGQSVKNNSPGNISASDSWPGNVWRPSWFELGPNPTARETFLHAEMLKGRAPQAFRAFDTFAQGMRDHVHTLARQFPSIIAARDPQQLAEAIYHSGYTRDHKPEEVAPTLAQLVTKIRKAGVFDDLARSPAPDPKAEEGAGSSPRYSLVEPPSLSLGSSGPLVKVWQRIVRAGDDGLFGEKTRDATRAWQARRGLPVTGMVDLPCWIAGTNERG